MKTKYIHGFTLLELMITLAMAAILAFIALPSMSSFIKNERLTTQINSLLSHLQYARSEAIKTHQQVTVCASSNASTCSGSWDGGWIVKVTNPDDTETVLKAHVAITGGNTLGSNGVGSIIYDYRGFTPDSSATFTVCDARGVNYCKSISISKTGRIRNGG